MEFRVLGPLEVVASGQPLGLGTPRQRLLLGLLLLRAGEVVSYDRLVQELWDDDPPGTARHTLQGYVHRLRRALGSEAWRLQTRPPGYRLKVSAGELDAEQFDELAGQGRRALVRGDPDATADLLAAALGLWRGPLLADLGEVAALEPERARREALRLAALEDRIEADLALGRHTALVGELEGLLTEHPFRERLWGQLMLALYRSDRQADALQAFHRARQILDQELGIQPSRWLHHRQEQILLQDAALDAPAPLPPPPPRHNLPARRSSFVGRRAELAELQGLLRTRRLVCVTGPPGAGKTRLALEAAACLLEAFPHGAWFVSLAEVADPEQVPFAVAAALGVPELPERPAAQALDDHLRSRRLLLVLDNFEHLLPAAVAAAQLLDAAPELTVLATSRAPLRLSGEQEYPLVPLPLPRPDELAADPAGNDALALFADRAAAVDPHFVLSVDNAPVVAEVVARLDGLPLAIELAAARLRLFPLQELARRLSPALPQLSGGRSTTLPGSGPCGTRSPGAMTYSAPPTGRSCGAWESSRAASPSRPPRRSPRVHPCRTSRRASPPWWRPACSAGRWDQANRATGCWRRSATMPWNSWGPLARTRRPVVATPASTRAWWNRPSPSSPASTRRAGWSGCRPSTPTSRRRWPGPARPATPT